MTGAGRAWRSLAGRQLARQVVRTAVEGRPVILRIGRGGALAALQAVADDFAVVPLALDARESVPPVSAVAGLADLAGVYSASTSVVRLVTDPALRDAVVVVGLEGVDPRPWLAFAGVFANARASCRERAASIVLLHRARCQVPAGCQALDDDGIVDPLDALLLMRDEAGWPRTLTAQTAAAALAEACRGDLDLLASLTSLRPEEAFEPFAAFARGVAPAEPDRLPWRGRAEPCPFWLAHRQPDRLRHRIWRGQLSVLFSWLEEVRSDFLQRARLGTAALEFADIAERLRRLGCGGRQLSAVHTLRATRNELAHCRALSIDGFRHAEAAAAILLSA